MKNYHYTWSNPVHAAHTACGMSTRILARRTYGKKIGNVTCAGCLTLLVEKMQQQLEFARQRLAEVGAKP